MQFYEKEKTMTTLKKIDPSSSEGADASLINLFALPETNIAVNHSNYRQLLPIAALSQEGPYVFRIFADNQFYDPSRTWLYLRTSIERKDTTSGTWVALDTSKVTEDKHVSVCQNFGHSFVRSIKLSVNGIECQDTGNLYAYRSYMLQELGHSNDVKKALFDCACYHTDEYPQAHSDGAGFKARAERFKDGKHCETMVRLNFDLANQNKLFLNNADVLITLHRNSDDFLLLQPDWEEGSGTTKTTKTNSKEYRLKVHDVQLYIVCADLTQSLNNAISRQLESGSVAKYPIRKIEVRNVFLNKGRTDLQHNIFVNQIPRRCIFALCKDTAFSGNRKLSPFEFEHANIQRLGVEANGQFYPSIPYQFDFDTDRCLRPFVDLYSALGMEEGSERTMSINLKRWLNGWTFFCIPMQSTLEDYGQNFEIIRNGTTAIKLAFKEPLKEAMTLIIIGEFDKILSINAAREVGQDATIV